MIFEVRLQYRKLEVDTISIYDYQRLVGKIDDIVELRNAFITVFDDKDKKHFHADCR